ncbi:transcriptional regulator, LysR family [Anopheles sinensis]|uniref:Transcriptional regulator, LysR family n=1 Tax=Anopheles sinensis TaxID=74873 RepID=A0A084VJZ4_ANOSI|nr:transcriptional regulator, LysR family [Anopheles sinensis]
MPILYGRGKTLGGGDQTIVLATLSPTCKVCPPDHPLTDRAEGKRRCDCLATGWPMGLSTQPQPRIAVMVTSVMSC